MNLIDNAKNLRTWVIDKWMPQPVVYHHVPKCGGTSVGRALRVRYIFSQAGIVSDAAENMVRTLSPDLDGDAFWDKVVSFREEMLLYYLHAGVRCIAAHVGFSKKAYDHFHNQYKFITVLRDPTERFVSHYFHLLRYYSTDEKTHPLDEFLQTPYAKRLGCRYVQYFSGKGRHELHNSQSLEDAKHHLQLFSAIGFLDSIEEFSSTLHSALGVRIRVGHTNKGPRDNSEPWAGRVTAEQLERIRMLCASDIELYQFARESHSTG